MTAGPVLIMAGGTGGHVYPALAVARELMARSVDVVWLGTQRGIESRLVPAAGIDIEWITVQGLRRKGLLAMLVAPVQILRAVLQSLAVIRRRRPTAVLGMGGFASGPGGLAAWLMRRPLLIHEQNAVPGLTNRLLSKFARVVMEAFPGSFGGRARTVGNPVRRDIADLPAPELRFAERDGPIRVLVLGGSQGALALNRRVPEALALIDPDRRPLVRHQCGSRTADEARAAYAAAGVEVELLEYIDDMAAVYGWADIAICRAGALTVAELCAAGLGAIFVPYPAAVDDHQTRNARPMEEQGAALIIAESELTAERLAGELESLMDRPALLQHAVRARELARPDALAEITEQCLRLAGGAA